MAKYCVVYNTRAGLISNVGLLRDLFAENKMDAKFIKCTRHVTSRIQKEIRAGAKVVVAAGGDGTVNIVANQIIGKNIALGVIPIGTFNHFAKDLDLPLEIRAAIAVIKRGRAIPVDCAKVNNRFFVNISSIGIYPRFVHARAHSSFFGKWLASIFATIKIISWPLVYDLDFSVDGKRFSREASLIAITNNSYEITQTGFTNRSRLDSGHLCLYLIKARHPWHLSWIALKTYLGKTDQEPSFEEYTARRVRINIRGRRQKVHAALDGEVASLKSPLLYDIRPKSLKVIIGKGS